MQNPPRAAKFGFGVYRRGKGKKRRKIMAVPAKNHYMFVVSWIAPFGCAP
jgi:hypothetical protein